MFRWSFRRGRWAAIAGYTTALLATSSALALTTSSGQLWDSVPDAWVRGNSADAAYFGWDLFDGNGPALSFGRVLDDATVDLGVGTTATATRIFQGADGIANVAPTLYGHRSGSGNYYSGFGTTDFVDDTIAGIAPASGVGGSTTVVLQVIAGAPGGMGANALAGMQFSMASAGWSKSKDLYGTLSSGTGVYWQEWSAAGSDLPFSIHLTSTIESRSIDAIAVDTFWSNGLPVLNARTTIGVPEPTTGMLVLLGAALAWRVRRNFVHQQQ